MEFEIKVIEKDGEKLFQYESPETHETVLFNALRAELELMDGAISARRSGQDIGQIEKISDAGTHGPRAIFLDCSGIFTDVASTSTRNMIKACNFEIEDVLALEVPEFQYANLHEFLIDIYRSRNNFPNTLPPVLRFGG